MNLALLFIVTRKFKDESHGIIKLLSIIIPIYIQQTKNSTLVNLNKKKKLIIIK